MNTETKGRCRQEHQRIGHRGRGPSSAWLHEPKTVLGLIPVKAGQVFADLGCGTGDYAVEAAKIVGPGGKVYALDNRQSLIDDLSEKSKSLGLDNITVLKADITASLPVDRNSVDVAFIATVLHIFDLRQTGPAVFSGVSGILKPGGRLAVVECKKEEQSFGPPKHMRNAPDEIEAAAVPFGFNRIGYHDLGYNYMLRFTLKR